MRPKKVTLFPEMGRGNIFASLTRLHSRMCIRIFIINLKKQANKQKNKNKKKAKESNEEKRISPEN